MEVVMNWFTHQPVVLQALLAGLFTWFCTIVGSAVVFFFRTVSRRLLDIMLGFAGRCYDSCVILVFACSLN